MGSFDFHAYGLSNILIPNQKKKIKTYNSADEYKNEKRMLGLSYESINAKEKAIIFPTFRFKSPIIIIFKFID